MMLLIDNYDSFTYNLWHYLGEMGAETVVRRNDALLADEALAMKPEGIIISPGPCDPDRAGICLELITKAASINWASLWRKSGARPPTHTWQTGRD
jgi:anthranilate synthase component 2